MLDTGRPAIISDIVGVLASRSKWVVLSHSKPDGDTLGSAVALALAGRNLSKSVLLGGSDPMNPRYDFLLAGLQYQVIDDISDIVDSDTVVVSIDTANAQRSVKGIAELPANTPTVNIDHHIDNTLYADCNWINPKASATGEMIIELFLEAGWPLTKEAATALYAAIVTDNGNFGYASTTIDSHRYAIILLEAGVRPDEVMPCLDAYLSEGSLHMWGRFFSRVKTVADGLGAISLLYAKDFTETGALASDTENLAHMLLRLKGAKIAALCTETAGGIRVNLRARRPYKVRDIATKFGGGGHDLAAGCTVEQPLDKAVELIQAELEKYAASFDTGD